MIGYVKEQKIHVRDFNFRLMAYVLILSVIGVLVVHSATANEHTQSLLSTTVKQIIGVGGGLIICIVLSLIDYHKLVKYSWVFYAMAILALVYLLVFGQDIYGAKRWIYFPLLGTVQPSEFAKPALILALSFLVLKLKEHISKVWAVLLFFLVSAPILLMVLMEPDLSTAIVLMIIIVTALFLAGLDYKWIIGVIIAMIPFVVMFFIALYQPGQGILHKVFKEHQVERINAFFFPEQYPDLIRQQQNSIMAIGSGGFFGKGLGSSSLESVKNGKFLSEEQCDFIFAIIGEEMGFFGTMVVIILLGLVTFECFRTAKKCNDLVGKVIAGTAGSAIAFQSLINIGVALLLIPNTGIPLPFLSAGLSSLLSTYILIGFVLNTGLWGKLKRRVF